MEPSYSGGELRPASTGAAGSDKDVLGDPPNVRSLPIGLTADVLQCPICVDTIHDAFVTTCGHTFCYQCISTHLKHRRNCPSCGNYLTTDRIYPNFLLSKVLARAAATHAAETSSSLADLVQQALVGTDKKLHITDLDEVIGLLKGKRDQLARHEATSSLQLLLLFLKEAKLHKERELAALRGQLGVLERDLISVTRRVRQPAALQQALQPQPLQLGPSQTQQLSAPQELPLVHEDQAPCPQHHCCRQGALLNSSQQHHKQQHHHVRFDQDSVGRHARSSQGTSPHTADTLTGGNLSLLRSGLVAVKQEQEEAKKADDPRVSASALGAEQASQQPTKGAQQVLPQPASASKTLAASAVPAQPTLTAEAPSLSMQAPPGLMHVKQERGACQEVPVPEAAAQSQPNNQEHCPVAKAQPSPPPAAAHLTASSHTTATPSTTAQLGTEPTSAGLPSQPEAAGRLSATHSSLVTSAIVQQAATDAQPPSTAPPTTATTQLPSVTALGSAAALAAAQVPEVPGTPALPVAAPSLSIPTSALDIADLAREMHGIGQEAERGYGGQVGDELLALRAAKNRRIMNQFEQLQSCYLQLRAPSATQQQLDPNQGNHQQSHFQHQAQDQSCQLHVQHQSQLQEHQLAPHAHASTCLHVPLSSGPDMEAPGTASARHGSPLVHPRLKALGSMAGSPNVAPSATDKDSSKAGVVAEEASTPAYHRTDSSNNLQQFSQVLSTVTQHSRMAVQAEVPYAACGGWLRAGCMSTGGVASYPQPSSAILDMEFDLEEELLATCAGQRVFLWDYEDVLSTTPDSLEPVREFCCRSKLASISFSKHERALLAAGDSEGRVYLWDVSTRQVVDSYGAHGKRIWTLDFSPSGASEDAGNGGASHLLASGSDDHLLKVWSPKELQRPVAAVDTGANVCSVRFNPWNEHLIAVGSAAHTAMVYDLRMLRVAVHGGASAGVLSANAASTAPGAQPVASFGSHRKAVAYVCWAAEHELLSASTDSMLRLWDLHGVAVEGAAPVAVAAAVPAAGDAGVDARMGRCSSLGSGAGTGTGGQGTEAVHTYSGHTNERNFVGMSHAGNYIATGSETGEVFIYLKHINTPCIRHRLTSSYQPPSQTHHPHQTLQQPPPFISAVTWRQGNQTLMAANSQGHLWALALQQ